MHEYLTIYPTPTDVTGNRTIEIRLITKCTESKLEIFKNFGKRKLVNSLTIIKWI